MCISPGAFPLLPLFISPAITCSCAITMLASGADMSRVFAGQWILLDWVVQWKASIECT